MDMRRRFGWSAVFVVGCLVGALTSQFVRAARAATPPARWEYRCTGLADGITDASNALGAQGWEMVAAAGAGGGAPLTSWVKMVWCFKRPLP